MTDQDDTQAEDVPTPNAAPEAPADERVRLVPADWTVDSVSFTTGEGRDTLEHLITSTRPGNAPYLVGADEADEIITAAAQRGLAVTKEQSA